jgi:hypothetical protein
VISFMLQPHYPRAKRPQCPLNRRPGGPRTGLDAMAKRKDSYPYRESNQSRPARSLVAILTELPQFWKLMIMKNTFFFFFLFLVMYHFSCDKEVEVQGYERKLASAGAKNVTAYV